MLGICVRAPRDVQEQKVHALAERTAELLGVPGAVARERVVANSDYVGAGYGMPTPAMHEAMELAARTEGIVLDPVYSGKAMAGLIDLVRRGQFARHRNVVFLHTGGAAGLFGYVHARAAPGTVGGTHAGDVIGGMGPLATADFFVKKLLAGAPATLRRRSHSGADPLGAAVAVASGRSAA